MKNLFILLGTVVALSMATQNLSALHQFNTLPGACPTPEVVQQAQEEHGNKGQFTMQANDVTWHVYNSAVRATHLEESSGAMSKEGIEIYCHYSGTHKGEHTKRDMVKLKLSLTECTNRAG